jgi:predicted nucleotidyltransferase
MAKKPHKSSPLAVERIYWGADVPMREIRRFARAVAQLFDPEQIILFGSHAYGKPHADSDVDILVVMPARNKHSQAVRIRAAVSAPFPMDLLVRTPQEMRRRLSEGDLFHTEIVSKGKILYEKGDTRMGEEGRSRSPRRPKPRPANTTPA